MDTGEVVTVGPNCQDSCYHDPCVPAGTYRYGYALPYDCDTASASGAYYYDVIEVEATGIGCVVPPDYAPATPYAEKPPWDGKDNRLCKGTYEGPGACDIGRATATVFALQALALAAGLWLLRRRRRRAG